MLFIDIETYSSVDLKTAGAAAYAESDDFEILMAAWAPVDGETQIAIGEEAIKAIPGLWNPNVLKVAHNAGFERTCLAKLGPTPVKAWLDTMALAGEQGLPQSLDKLAKALGAEDKDSAGTRLINLFCQPYRGKRVMPADKPEQWMDFILYCIQDVDTLRDIANRLPHMWHSDMERAVWEADQRINDRGIKVDLELARLALQTAEDNQVAYMAELKELTDLENPNSVQQLQSFLRASGLELPDLRAETVSEALSGTLSPPQRRALELRQEMALTASKKYAAALAGVSKDGRLRGQFRYFGAHTGRWAGRGVQLQNLPRATVDDPEASILDLKMGLGADSKTLKALVRSMFSGPFVVADYSAIEARVLAWLAGEDWVLEAFERGRDIYVETAERMGGLTRFQGKVAVLALGYNGAVGSLRAMGAEGDDAELKRLVIQWRKANPRIVRFWSKMEDAFKRGGVAGLISVEVVGKDRHVKLPSGRVIIYRGVKVEQREMGERLTFISPMGYRTDTYGGRLTENVTQAVARDVLADALVRLEDNEFPVVAHIHDEVVVEVQGDGERELEIISGLMCQENNWNQGLPLSAAGFVTERYRKG